MGPFQVIIFIVWALSALALIALVLMHSGKGTGVSDMIASSLYNSSAATGVMERNLDRRRGLRRLCCPVHVLLPAGRNSGRRFRLKRPAPLDCRRTVHRLDSTVHRWSARKAFSR